MKPLLPCAIAASLMMVGCTNSDPASSAQPTLTSASSSAPAGDASTPKAVEPRTPEDGVTVLEAGVGGKGDYVWVAAVVQTGPVVGQFLTVNFNVLDKSGALVASESQVEQVTVPSARMIIGTQVELAPDQAASVEATADLGSTGAGDLDPFPAIATDVTAVKGEWGSQARFALRNPVKAPLKSPRISILCRDKTKKIIGGGIDFPDLVPAGGQVLVKADVLVSGTPSSCEAFVGAPLNWEEISANLTTSPPTSTPDQSHKAAADAFKTWVDNFDAREWAVQYQTLVPDQKKIVSEQQFVKCRTIDEPSMPRARWVKLVSTRDEKSSPIPGTAARRDSVKVTATLSFDGMKAPIDAHMYLVDGTWTWSMDKPEECTG